MPVPIHKRTAVKNYQSSAVAKKAARNAMLKVAGTTKVSQTQLERVVQSVNDATKRLSQPDSILSTSTTTKSSKRRSRDTVGPWKLGKTLGKGSSGRVRLAKNMESGQLAAIKIVPKKGNLHLKNDVSTTSTPSASYTSNSSTMLNTTANNYTTAGHSNVATNPYGIEREIVIMKLISHSNVLGLYEVWENKSELYLVLEYVDGGELFDYLVSKGKLCEREAVHYFKQIIQGVSYCHSFNICHRDLKPENLLLDKKNSSIKIADFGMAALEVSNKLLQTSCGSPHYASPEIVMGKPYHGGPSDVWSCGIILFALLTGHLPFNDDSIKKLLLKVQSGKYRMPQNLSKEAQDLISRILVINPAKRMTTEEILSHPLIVKYDKLIKTRKYRALNKNMAQGKSDSDLHLLNDYDPSNIILTSRRDIDETILGNLQILWHGASRELIVAKLLQPSMTEEKVFYALLLKYKDNHNKKQQAMAQPEQEMTLPESSMEGNESPEEPCSEDISAPKILQKSQFSIPLIKQEEEDSAVPSLPPKPLPPTIPVFAASSSRSFRKSGSTLSLQSQKSLKIKASLPHSASRVSISRTSSKKTLQNSASKRSLYSLNSISKRSLNLSEYVGNDNGVEFDQLPPLPSLDSTNGFENLCEQILFGNALDKILEEEEEEEGDGIFGKSSSTSRSSNATLTKELSTRKDFSPLNETIRPAFIFGNDDSENSFDPNKNGYNKNASTNTPLTDITNTCKPSKRRPSKLKRDISQKSNLSGILDHKSPKRDNPLPSSRELRVPSAPQPHGTVYSLDPRRNISQPTNTNKLESLLNGFRSRSNPVRREQSRDWNYSRGSIFLERCQEADNGVHEKDKEQTEPDQSCLSDTVPDFDSSDLDILAHSSTVQKNKITLNASNTFKDLNEYLQETNESYVLNAKKTTQPNTRNNTMRKRSTKINLTPRSALTAALGSKQRHSHNCSVLSNDLELMSDMSFALEIPTNTFMAQAVTISNGGSAEHVVADHGNDHDSIKNEEDMIDLVDYTPASTHEENRVNIFEDPPIDSDSLDITSSESDSSPNIHRKAVSIDTLNTTNVLPPTTNVRVSLYANNNLNSNAALPRETTEEIISKFKLSPEKPSAPLIQKRFSMVPANKSSERADTSQGMFAMFKDLEEDEESQDVSQVDLLAPSVKDGLEKQNESQPNRVTMLFDGEEVDHDGPKLDEVSEQDEEIVLTHKKELKPVNKKPETATKKPKPTVKMRVANPDFSYNASKSKKNWFSKLFGGFKSNSDDARFVKDHKTSISFDDAHMLTLNEFDKNAVEYHLKSSERRGLKEKVEYDCKFISGNFKFKIKIVTNEAPDGVTTIITVKRKGRAKTLSSESIFEQFNRDVGKVIKQAEKRKGSVK